jgi:hypothetical protein
MNSGTVIEMTGRLFGWEGNGDDKSHIYLLNKSMIFPIRIHPHEFLGTERNNNNNNNNR